MNQPSFSNVLIEIEQAFEGVTLGDGISLREAEVLDDNGSAEERAEARARDETQVWRKIPDEVIETSADVLCFMDPAGLRFHLPPYMHFALRRCEDSDSLGTESAIYRLTDSECIEMLRQVLTPRQIGVVLAFLAACSVPDSFDSHRKRIGLAIRQWHGEEAARHELRSMEKSIQRSANEMMELSFEVGFDWFTKYVDGELNVEQAERARLALDTIGGCGLERSHGEIRSSAFSPSERLHS